MEKQKIVLYVAAMFYCISSLFARGSSESSLAKDYFELGQSYAEISKYDKAIEYYGKAAKNPEHANAAEYELARMYALKGDWKSALRLLEPHYKKASENTTIRNAFVYALAASGKSDRACGIYKKIYDQETENPEAAFNYIRIMIVAKKYEAAQAVIDKSKIKFIENDEKKILDELESTVKKAIQRKNEKKMTQDGNVPADK